MSVRNSCIVLVMLALCSVSVLGISFYEGGVYVEQYSVVGTVSASQVTYTGRYLFTSTGEGNVQVTFPGIPGGSVRTATGVFDGTLVFAGAGTQELMFSYSVPLTNGVGEIRSELLFNGMTSATPMGTVGITLNSAGVRLVPISKALTGQDDALRLSRSGWYPETLRFSVMPEDERLLVVREVGNVTKVGDRVSVTYTLTNGGTTPLRGVEIDERVLATYFTLDDVRFTRAQTAFEPAYHARLGVPDLAPGETGRVSYTVEVTSLAGPYLLPVRVLLNGRVIGSVDRQEVPLTSPEFPTVVSHPPVEQLDAPFTTEQQFLGRQYEREGTFSWVFWGSIVLIVVLLVVFRERIMMIVRGGRLG